MSDENIAVQTENKNDLNQEQQMNKIDELFDQKLSDADANGYTSKSDKAKQENSDHTKALEDKDASKLDTKTAEELLVADELKKNNPDDKDAKEYLKDDDYKQLIKLPDDLGEISISELKDQAVEYRKVEQRTKDLDLLHTELATDRKLVMDVANTLQQLTPEQTNAIKAQREYTVAREKGLLMDSIPEWKENAQVMIKDRDDMLETLNNYGVPEREFHQIIDSRLIRMIRDYDKLSRRFNDAERRLKENKVSSQQKQLSKRKPDTKDKSKSKVNPNVGSIETQMNALDEIFSAK